MTTEARLNQRRVLSAGTLVGDPIVNPRGEHIGDLKEIMIDIEHGRVAYGVISFGGFLGMGEKLFAVPWGVLAVDQVRHDLVLDIDKDRLDKMEGFDPNNWPDFSDPAFGERTYTAYGVPPYWT